ncbi:MAG: hypothetical protein Q7W55_17015 [Pseudohongiella sp.]|nr:hypothetical protein [Pseudohongiella sp.]
MKRSRVYLIIGALLLCIILVALAIVSRTRAVEAANVLAVEINSQALSSWDAALIVTNSEPSLLAQGGPDFFYTYFAALRRLGSLQEIDDIVFTMELPRLLLPGSQGTASYTMNAVFTQGHAEIRITLMRRDGRWWFSEYLVLTPLMAS